MDFLTFLLISFLFYFIFDLGLGFYYDVTVTAITQSYNTEKIIEDSRTNDII